VEVAQGYAIHNPSLYASSLFLIELTIPTAHDISFHLGVVVQVDISARDDQNSLYDARRISAPVPDNDGAFDAAASLQGYIAVEDDQVAIQLLIFLQRVILIPNDDTIVARRALVCQRWRGWQQYRS
jgi:hypothetical protein